MTVDQAPTRKPRFIPGSMTPATEDDIRGAWAVRGSDPERTRRVLFDARNTWRLRTIAALVEAPEAEVRPFTTAAIPEADADILRGAHDETFFAHGELPHSSFRDTIATFRSKGWSFSDIAAAVGVSRQSIHRHASPAKSASPKPMVIKDIARVIEDKPQRLHRDPLRFPRYATDPEDARACVPISVVPQESIDKLATLIRTYQGTREHKDAAKVLKLARSLRDQYRVSYTQLSRASLGHVNRYLISRIALGDGEDVYVP